MTEFFWWQLSCDHAGIQIGMPYFEYRLASKWKCQNNKLLYVACFRLGYPSFAGSKINGIHKTEADHKLVSRSKIGVVLKLVLSQCMYITFTGIKLCPHFDYLCYMLGQAFWRGSGAKWSWKKPDKGKDGIFKRNDRALFLLIFHGACERSGSGTPSFSC